MPYVLEMDVAMQERGQNFEMQVARQLHARSRQHVFGSMRTQQGTADVLNNEVVEAIECECSMCVSIHNHVPDVVITCRGHFQKTLMTQRIDVTLQSLCVGIGCSGAPSEQTTRNQEL
jgi:hypothetical protein